jgi:hypothetical protein
LPLAEIFQLPPHLPLAIAIIRHFQLPLGWPFHFAFHIDFHAPRRLLPPFSPLPLLIRRLLRFSPAAASFRQAFFSLRCFQISIDITHYAASSAIDAIAAVSASFQAATPLLPHSFHY